MRQTRTLLLAAALIAPLAGTAMPAWASGPDLTPQTPIRHVQDAKYADSRPSPYAMNYTDDAARTLGVKDGHWQAFDTGSSSPLVPSLNGGVDSGGAMLKLQWH